MSKKKISKKLMCFTLIGSLLSSNIVLAKPSISEESKDSIVKEETVYTILSSDGTVKNQIVNNLIENNTSNFEIKDKSNLENIKVLNGDYRPDKIGQDLLWKENKKEILYQGKTKQQLPINIKITYFLNGKKIKPKDLAGKSGKVKIKIDIENKKKQIVNVDGKNKTLYTPISVATAILLPEKTFSNVETNTGIVKPIYGNNIVTFAAVPGMMKSFGLVDGKFSNILPDTLEITADVKKFKMAPIYMVASPKIPNIDTIKAAKSLDELGEGLEALKDATALLLDGTGQLNDGLGMLYPGIIELNGGLAQLDAGSKALAAGTGQLNDGVNQIKGGIDKIKRRLAGVDVDKMLAQLNAGLNAFDTGMDTVDNLYNKIYGLQINPEYAEKINKGLDIAGNYLDYLMLSQADLEMINLILDTTGGFINDLELTKEKAEQINDLIGIAEDTVKKLELSSDEVDLINEEIDTIGKYIVDLESSYGYIEKIKNEISKLKPSLDDLNTNLDDLNDDSIDLETGVTNLDDDIKDVKDNYTGEFTDTIEELNDLIKKGKEEDPENPKYDKMEELVNKLIAQTKPTKTNNPTIYDGLNDISDNVSDELKPETNQLSNKITDTSDSVNDEIEVISEVDNIVEFFDKLKLSTEDLEKINETIEKIGDGVGGLKLSEEQLEKINEVIDEIGNYVADLELYQEDLEKINASIGKIEDGLNKLKIYPEDLGNIKDEVGKLKSYVASLDLPQEDSEKLMKAIGKLEDYVEKLEKVPEYLYKIRSGKQKIDNIAGKIDSGELRRGAKQFTDGVTQLNDGAILLSNGMGLAARSVNDQVLPGVGQLYDGSNALLAGMNQFNDEGILKLYGSVSPLLVDAKDILKTKDELVKLSEDAQTYTGKDENMESEVKFIIKIDEIKESEVKKQPVKPNKEKESFWQKIKSIF